MSTITDEINDQISAGRRTIQRSLDDMPNVSVSDVPRPVVMATGLAVFVAAVGIGWMVYRRRRRRTLVRRLQDAMPDSVPDVASIREAAKNRIARIMKPR